MTRRPSHTPQTPHTPMGAGHEFDAIRALLARWGPRASGIGDDGAVLDVPAGSRLVVSTDSSVEDVHFRRAWLTPEEIGWRATTAALSDLAAMGAAPLGLLLAMTVPRTWRDALDALAEGIGAAAAEAGAPIVGGDVTDGDRLALTLTVLGHAARPLSRNGARAGDALYVTGRLGGPHAALAAWELGAPPSAVDRARFAHPEARLAAGEWLAAHGAHAAIDLSDGLSGDAAHLAAASAVRLVIAIEAVPTLAHATPEQALVSGEEYELLVAAAELTPDDLSGFSAATGGLPLTRIGRAEPCVGDATGGEVVIERAGRPISLPGAHDHFAAR